jgi:hypothetical protein
MSFVFSLPSELSKTNPSGNNFSLIQPPISTGEKLFRLPAEPTEVEITEYHMDDAPSKTFNHKEYNEISSTL